MIDARELRIGNWVRLEKSDSFYKVDYIDWSGALIGCLEKGIDDYLAIPLTEEWLIKFGFEEWSTVNEDQDDNGGWVIEKSNKDRFYLNDELQPTDLGFPILDYELEYVHQLQNLYFALTGEELTIKP